MVVVGAAARDVAPDDPRGWRLGGGVTYGALTLARLGLRTACLIGLDGPAAEAREVDVLRAAGAEVVAQPLERGPVFHNQETAAGRVQRCLSLSDVLRPAALPEAWRSAGAWLLAPVADEVDEAWAAAIPRAAVVGLGWQGLLRHLSPGAVVRRRAPAASAVVRRADIVGVSAADVEAGTSLGELLDLLRPGAVLAVTMGDRGGWLAVREAADAAGPPRLVRYPAIPAGPPVDPTGAGDVFLAALLAARLEPRLAGGRSRRNLFLAAAAASLVVEEPGLAGVPGVAAIADRLAEFRRLGAPT